MPIAPHAAVHPADAGPRPVAANRRRQARLRDLCDEVLASFRVARERDVVTAGDREAANSVLATMIPALRR